MKNKALTYYLKYVSCGYICDNACKSKKENIPHQTKKEKKSEKKTNAVNLLQEMRLYLDSD